MAPSRRWTKTKRRLVRTVMPKATDQEFSFPQRLKTFAFWASWVGVAFFSVYPTTNWLTGLRGEHYALYLPQELELPFVAGFIWLYLSMYLLFMLPPFFLGPRELKRLGVELVVATIITGVVFLLLPAKLGFLRILPEEALYRDLYAGLFALDRPFNLVPSLHVIYSTAILLAIARKSGAYSRSLLYAWLLLIVSSTLLVHQHHLLDVASGLMLATATTVFLGRKYA
jgi:membrane-associated phospholipid phosphatase